MSMADFIERNLELILADWEAFAATQVPAAERLDSRHLRNFAADMLRRVVADMRTSQSSEEQARKSRGELAGRAPAVDSAARQHAMDRLKDAFTQQQMVAEFRALRASVIRHWQRRLPEVGSTELEEMTRFNEVVDQLLTESLVWYDQALHAARAQTTQALGERGQRHRALADLSPDAIVVIAGGRVAYANAAAIRLLGAESPYVVIGLSPFEIVQPSFHQRLRESIRTALSGQPLAGLAEWQWKRLDGSLVEVEVAAGPLPWDEGNGVQLIGREITERKNNERMLREREARFRHMADSLPLIVWVHDAQGNQEFVNLTFCEFFGVTRDQMRGGCWQMLMHPDDAGAYEEEFNACLRERRPFHAEVRVRNASGRWRWLESWARPRYSSGGEFEGLIGTSADITEKKQIEDALQRTLAKSEAMFNQMTEGLVVFDPQGNLLDMNPAALEIHGFDSVEQLRRHLDSLTDTFELYDMEDRLLPTADWPIGRVLRGETFRAYEVGVRRADTGRSWIGSYGGTPVYGPDGTLLLAIVTLRDVTDRHEAEAALSRAKQRLETALTATEVGVWYWDIPNNRIRGDRNMIRLIGLGDNERVLALEELAARVHEDDRESVAEAVDTAVAEGGLYEKEYRVVHPNGQVRWLHARGRVETDEQGKALAFPGVAVDITRRKQVEEALHEADRRKDEFLATLAHELRNPLAPIQSGVEILRLNGAEGALREQTLAMMERQMGHLVRLVDDLLEVSRISRGKISLRREQVDLLEAVRSSVEAAAASFPADRRIALELPPGPLMVEVDPVRLSQIIMNLMNNAVKYTQEQGHIRIAADRDGDQVRICVRDDGIGLSGEMLEQVFRPFRQADPGGTAGLGIGLTLVRSLAELHGGSVRAFSEGPGHGSEFVVLLPLPRDESPSKDSPRSAQETVSTLMDRRVMVVDDNRDVAAGLGMLLEIQGAEVSTVNDGRTALELFDRFQPQVVFLDIGMPEMDGYEVARRLRAAHPDAGTLLVAITGWGQDEDRERVREAGFDFHLVKPVSVRDIDTILGPVNKAASEV